MTLATSDVSVEFDAASKDATEQQFVLLSIDELEHVGGGNLVANF